MLLVRVQPGALMFLATAFAYPLVLAVLCLGAGLLADRLSGTCPARAAAARRRRRGADRGHPARDLCGIRRARRTLCDRLLAPRRYRISSERDALLRVPARSVWLLVPPLLVYMLALAPVILAGRPSFSSYLVLGDSAVHMLGADFLLRHGQDYSHLDLSTSNGRTSTTTTTAATPRARTRSSAPARCCCACR